MTSFSRSSFFYAVVSVALSAITLTSTIYGAELTKRPAWTTSRVTGTPDPPSPYLVERVFPNLKFDQPTEIVNAPGTNRLFVAELLGKVFSFVPGPDATADLAIDLKQAIPGLEQVYALAFHPQFEQNHYIYVCYVFKAEIPDGTHISRFRVTDTNPPTIDVTSEKVLITWLSGGHNGCCLKFGPDGYLYISTGDGAGPNPPDILRTGQDLSDLLSSILRIDVDQEENGKPYRIPEDNPFIGQVGARPEIWAYGFRNPWKMSFSPNTGDLLVGDVGWELWEMVYRVKRGGNYGWSVMEGRQATNPEWPRGPTPIEPPLVDHPHSEAASVTGGFVYRGNRLPELRDAYVYGDFQTGKMWALRYEGDKVHALQELVDTTLQIIGFTETNDGELYVMDHQGPIYQLAPNPKAGTTSAFPQKLSETGLFSSTAALTPAPGVIPYTINAEPWADGAIAIRHFAIPGSSAIKFGGLVGEKWEWPQDSVLARTFFLNVSRETGTSPLPIETQILHFDGVDWHGYTYVWNEDHTDAVLLDAAGADQTFQVGDLSNEGEQQQTWHFASRAECARCHNPWSGPVLGFNSPQLNRDVVYGDTSLPQLAAFEQIGIFEKPLPKESPPRLADLRDADGDLGSRARAYLHTNCAHCHRMHAGSAVLSQMPYDLELSKTIMLGVRPTQGTFGIHAAHVIAPSDPCRSVLLYRMSKLGSGRMPHIGSNVVDKEGTKLIRKWIESLSADETTENVTDTTGNETAAHLRREEHELLDRLTKPESADAGQALIKQLLSRTSGALMLLGAIQHDQVPEPTRSAAITAGAQHEDVCVRDLFEQFMPEESRTKRLGSLVNADELLRMKGDALRGRKLLLETATVQCKNCHRIQHEGKQVGPDLNELSKKYDRAQILEQILEPSKKIDPQYVTYLAETKDGRQLTGLLLKRDANDITLADNQGNAVQIAADDIEQLVPQRQSLMPDLQLRDLTPQQVADLLEYLSSPH